MLAKQTHNQTADMTSTVDNILRRPKALEGRITSSLAFDWAMALLGIWFSIGVHLDGWAHQHVPDLETFFTPWHAAFYSAYAVVVIVLAWRQVTGMRQGYSWRDALPVGYGLSAVGAVLFFIGGIADMTWHTLLGIEVNVEALLSPSHLLLATSGVIMAAGPLRATWHSAKGRDITWLRAAPALLSAVVVLSTITFFTQYGHPFATTWAANAHRVSGIGLQNWNQGLAMISTLFQSALLVGLLLVLLRRWNLPFGSITAIVGINTALLTFMRDNALERPGPLSTGALPLIGVALLAGVVGDLLAAWLRPSPANVTATRIFAFALPAILYALYYLLLALSGGIWWTPPVWSGAIFLAGIAGLLTSYLAVPPAADEA